MQDPKFEKQVQQKMEELVFSPSEVVWAKVDAEINKDRKRRKPFLWLFVFLGLSLAGGIYFISTYTKPVSKNAITKQGAPDVTTGNNNQPTVSAAPGTTELTTGKKKPVIANTRPVIRDEKIRAENQSLHENSLATDQDRRYLPKDNKKDQSKVDAAFKQKNEQNTAIEKIDQDNEFADKNRVAKLQDGTEQDKKTNIQDTAANKNSIVSASSLENKNLPVAANQPPAKKETKPIAKKKNSSSWQVGLTAGAGISSIGDGVFKSTHVGSNNYFPAAAPSNPIPPAPHYASSEIKPYFSFKAGFFLKKPLTKKIAVSVGLNYQYYSTKINTGSAADSLAYVYSFNLTPARVTTYYRNGNSDSYINHYHFLELPVSLDFQLNRNKKMPVVWEAGASVLYLVSSNALQFDQVTGVYYKNNNLFNRTQFNAATALMIGLPFHGNVWQAGPQLQYGLSRLLQKNAGNTEHLFFAGIKLSAVLGKK